MAWETGSTDDAVSSPQVKRVLRAAPAHDQLRHATQTFWRAKSYKAIELIHSAVSIHSIEVRWIEVFILLQVRFDFYPHFDLMKLPDRKAEADVCVFGSCWCCSQRRSPRPRLLSRMVAASIPKAVTIIARPATTIAIAARRQGRGEVVRQSCRDQGAGHSSTVRRHERREPPLFAAAMQVMGLISTGTTMGLAASNSDESMGVRKRAH